MAIDIGRREFISGLGGDTAAWPFAPRAQELAGRTAQIGLLRTSLDDPISKWGYRALLDELKQFDFSGAKI
jgi:hypothetical protein